MVGLFIIRKRNVYKSLYSNTGLALSVLSTRFRVKGEEVENEIEFERSWWSGAGKSSPGVDGAACLDVN